jgi:hypothetical protein
VHVPTTLAESPQDGELMLNSRDSFVQGMEAEVRISEPLPLPALGVGVRHSSSPPTTMQKLSGELADKPAQVRVTLGLQGLNWRHENPYGSGSSHQRHFPSSTCTEIDTIPPQLPPLADAVPLLPRHPAQPLSTGARERLAEWLVRGVMAKRINTLRRNRLSMVVTSRAI